ncbi:MAG: ABC transporter ATP-binding protein [Candidatus Promineifilaceae bacterium]|nr:ABC transporter ATP-binding protein [Candidatus Promineifilaceae bacterium]
MTLDQVEVQRSGRTVLTIPHLTVREGRLLAVVGPNGAGKSTLLLTLAHLLEPVSGQLLYRGQLVKQRDILAYRRRLGLAFQKPLLLSGSVLNNAATGLALRGMARTARRERALHWLERFGVAHLSQRSAHQLSGGESQRVSLARALATDPEVLLLDEPFAGLDAPTRERLLDDFQRMLADVDLTVVLVTHDPEEALVLADQMIVLWDGQIRQAGPPATIFSAPVDAEVATFVGVETIVNGQVVAARDGQVTIAVNDLHLDAVADLDVGRDVLFCIRPEDLTLWTAEELPTSSARNQLPGTIRRLSSRGPLVNVVVDCGFSITAQITRASAEEMALALGQRVVITFKASAVHLIAR